MKRIGAILAAIVIAISISILCLTGQVSKAAVAQAAPETETRPTETILDEDTCTYVPEGTRFWMPER